MKPENAIEVKDVTKKFKVYLDKGHTLKEKTLFRKRRAYEERSVLNGISFEVKKGEAVGLIGHNGCGKSTTLKLLTKIMYPDSGTIEMCGRVSSLIELGAGFHPDLSGRENIYINASIFGLTRKEIDDRMKDIVAFSELEEFIDNPVRTYSSGMYMRLAFSVAIHVDADILLIDEILTVGDVYFQSKCLNRLLEIKQAGVTIVLVSHSFSQVEKICGRLIWLNQGLVQIDGRPEDVYPNYLEYMYEKAEAGEVQDNIVDEFTEESLCEDDDQSQENVYHVDMKIRAKNMEFSNDVSNFAIPIFIRNTSSKDLLNEEQIYLSFHIRSLNDNYSKWDNERFPINLLKGKEKIIYIKSTLPDKEGEYILQLDIVQEGVGWYSQQGEEFPYCCMKVISKKTKVGFDDVG